MKLVRLPGGPFRMGSPEDEPGRASDEPVAGEANVPGPIFVSAHEVTHGQFLAVMGRSPARYPPKMRNPATFPVDSVTWAEANEFCQRLTANERDRSSQWAYRLPTEAEWEYACRGMTETPYWSGNRLTLGEHAIYDGEQAPDRERTERHLPYPVGSTTANPFGLYDMHGNVWEWVADPVEAGRRVARGGSWREPAARCRSAARRHPGPMDREPDLGFRVVYAPVN
jgi:formylglycine-generating enzyme required for sulfatase activity